MAYTPLSARNIAPFSSAWMEATNILDILNNNISKSFQVQANRNDLANILAGSLVKVANYNTRFPLGFYVYRYDDQIKVAFNNILAATDTKNRIVEVADGSAPSTQVELNSVRRTDDATVAIRSAIQEMIDLIINQVGFYDQATFESKFGLTWA